MRSVPEWLTKGRTVLVVKDKGKGGEVPNFAPITCLHVPLMWKLFTAVIVTRHNSMNILNERVYCPRNRKNVEGTHEAQ